MPTVRIGLLGASRVAPYSVVKPARALPDVEVTAVAARDSRRSAEFAVKHGIRFALDDYDSLIGHSEVDAVYVALPNSLHGYWSAAALAAGKHVLCEKPLTANAEEATTIDALASGGSQIVMEAMHWRYHPMTDYMLDTIRCGLIGDLVEIRASFTIPAFRRDSICYRPELAGGTLLHQGVYPVSSVRLLSGHEPTVTAANAKYARSGVERSVEARLALPDGASAIVRCSCSPARPPTNWLTAKGTLGTLGALNPFLPHFGGIVRVKMPGKRRIVRFGRPSSYQFQLGAFAAAVVNETAYPTTTADAVANMRVIDSIFAALTMDPGQPTPDSHS